MGRALFVAFWLFVVAGCASGQPAADAEGSAGSTTSQPTASAPLASEPLSTSSTATAATGAPWASVSEATTETVATPGFPDGGGPGVTYLTGVQIGRHPGFDRVVWRFDGPMPAYRVAYIDRPITEDGSGAEIAVRGDAALQIILTPASGTDLSGGEPRPVYTEPERIDGADAGTTSVQELVQTGDFEATLGWVVGVARQAPFVVRELSDPSRIVVDIAHP